MKSLLLVFVYNMQLFPYTFSSNQSLDLKIAMVFTTKNKGGGDKKKSLSEK